MNLSSLYSNRIIKEFQIAFDISSETPTHNQGPTLVITNNPLYATEFFRRSIKDLSFLVNPKVEFNQFIEGAKDWTQSNLSLSDLDQQKKFDKIIWVLPNKSEPKSIIEQVTAKLTEDAELIVILPGLLHTFLPEKKVDSDLPLRAYSSILSAKLFRQSGLRLLKRIGIHSLNSIIYSLTARGMQLLGFSAWCDRLIFSSRSVYQELGWLWSLSTLVVSYYQKHRS